MIPPVQVEKPRAHAVGYRLAAGRAEIQTKAARLRSPLRRSHGAPQRCVCRDFLSLCLSPQGICCSYEASRACHRPGGSPSSPFTQCRGDSVSFRGGVSGPLWARAQPQRGYSWAPGKGAWLGAWPPSTPALLASTSHVAARPQALGGLGVGCQVPTKEKEWGVGKDSHSPPFLETRYSVNGSPQTESRVSLPHQGREPPKFRGPTMSFRLGPGSSHPVLQR